MSPQDVMLRAYDVVEAALTASTQADAAAAAAAAKLELEVLPREELLRVAKCVVVETTRVLVAPSDRPRMLDRLQRRRLSAMVADL